MTIIAIDGDSASGKGTLARKLAEILDFAYLDTGLLYRATGFIALKNNKNLMNPVEAEWAARQVRLDQLSADSLRTEDVSRAASIVAAYPGVRAALLELQRAFAAHPPGGKKGAVLDGRDIGTVICPSAEIKVYITASPAIRAKRRQKELQEKGIEAIQSQVFADMQERDRRDKARETAPLKAAEDALVLDTTYLDPTSVLQNVLRHIESKKPGLLK